MANKTAKIKLAVFSVLTFITRPIRGHGLLVRFPVLQKVYGLYKNIYDFSKPHQIMLWQKPFYLDPHDTLEMARQKENYEEKTTAVFKQLLRAGDVVADIGANIGFFTVLAATLVGDSGKVFAFEPEPNFYNLLQKNIAAGDYKHVVPSRKAVSEKSGEGYAFFDSTVLPNGTDASAQKPKTSSAPRLDVEAVALDDFFRNQRGPNLIKMDIEGGEGSVLQGAKKLLGDNRDIKIIAEFNPKLLDGYGIGTKAFLDLARSFGFSIYDINGPGGIGREVSDSYLLETYWSGAPLDYTNILLARHI
jgi:FkbM family methyltransferase